MLCLGQWEIRSQIMKVTLRRVLEQQMMDAKGYNFACALFFLFKQFFNGNDDFPYMQFQL